MTVPTKAVQTALEKIGIFPAQAQAAAADTRLDWSVEQIQACVDYVRSSGPGSLYAQYLKAGAFPPVAAPVMDDADDGFTIPPKMLKYGRRDLWPDWVRALDHDPEVQP